MSTIHVGKYIPHMDAMGYSPEPILSQQKSGGRAWLMYSWPSGPFRWMFQRWVLLESPPRMLVVNKRFRLGFLSKHVIIYPGSDWYWEGGQDKWYLYLTWGWLYIFFVRARLNWCNAIEHQIHIMNYLPKVFLLGCGALGIQSKHFSVYIYNIYIYIIYTYIQGVMMPLTSIDRIWSILRVVLIA